MKRVIEAEDDSKRAPPVTGNRTGTPSKCEPFRELIEEKFEQGRDAKRIREDLVEEKGFQASYSSIQFFVKELKSASPKEA